MKFYSGSVKQGEVKVKIGEAKVKVGEGTGEINLQPFLSIKNIGIF